MPFPETLSVSSSISNDTPEVEIVPDIDFLQGILLALAPHLLHFPISSVTSGTSPIQTGVGLFSVVWNMALQRDKGQPLF